jgi:hypothetical protein
VPNEGSKCAPHGSIIIHIQINKVKFLKFWGATNGLEVEAWLCNITIFFALRDYNSNMK